MISNSRAEVCDATADAITAKDGFIILLYCWEITKALSDKPRIKSYLVIVCKFLM